LGITVKKACMNEIIGRRYFLQAHLINSLDLNFEIIIKKKKKEEEIIIGKKRWYKQGELLKKI